MRFGDGGDLISVRNRLRGLLDDLESVGRRKHPAGVAFDARRGKHAFGTPFDLMRRKQTLGTAFDIRGGKHAFGAPFELRRRKHPLGAAFDIRGGKHTFGVPFELMRRKHPVGAAFDLRRGKHGFGIPYAVSGGKHAIGFAYDVLRALQQLSARVDVLADRAGVGSGGLGLETALRQVLTQCRVENVDRKTLEDTIVKQLDFVYRDPPKADADNAEETKQ